MNQFFLYGSQQKYVCLKLGPKFLSNPFFVYRFHQKYISGNNFKYPLTALGNNHTKKWRKHHSYTNKRQTKEEKFERKRYALGGLLNLKQKLMVTMRWASYCWDEHQRNFWHITGEYRPDLNQSHILNGVYWFVWSSDGSVTPIYPSAWKQGPLLIDQW